MDALRKPISAIGSWFRANPDRQPLPLHGVTLRPVELRDLDFVRAVNDPLWWRTRMLAQHCLRPGKTARSRLDFVRANTDEEACELLYQFLVPLERARAELKEHREIFRQRALAATLDRFGPVELRQLVAAAIQRYVAWIPTLSRRKLKELAES